MVGGGLGSWQQSTGRVEAIAPTKTFKWEWLSPIWGVRQLFVFLGGGVANFGMVLPTGWFRQFFYAGGSRVNLPQLAVKNNLHFKNNLRFQKFGARLKTTYVSRLGFGTKTTYVSCVWGLFFLALFPATFFFCARNVTSTSNFKLSVAGYWMGWGSAGTWALAPNTCTIYLCVRCLLRM